MVEIVKHCASKGLIGLISCFRILSIRLLSPVVGVAEPIELLWRRRSAVVIEIGVLREEMVDCVHITQQGALALRSIGVLPLAKRLDQEILIPFI